MKNILRLFVIITIHFSCQESEQETLNEKFIFNYNLHESLPNEWVTEFYTIIGNLEILIPAKPRSYQNNMNIYSWVSNIDKPFKKNIGNTTGACICGNDKERYMVLEIPENEDTWEYWLKWLKDRNLKSAITGYQNLPHWVSQDEVKGRSYVNVETLK